MTKGDLFLAGSGSTGDEGEEASVEALVEVGVGLSVVDGEFMVVPPGLVTEVANPGTSTMLAPAVSGMGVMLVGGLGRV